MFSGVQISLYLMSGDFVGIISQALAALDPYREGLRIDTDDISTLLIGPPEVLFPAMRDLYAAAATTGVHCVLSAAISRGWQCLAALMIGAHLKSDRRRSRRCGRRNPSRTGKTARV